MLVVGGGATGVRVASIFNGLGASVHLFEAEVRMLITEDEAVSTIMAAALRANGITVSERFGKDREVRATAQRCAGDLFE
jgi:dihydrolipoamide dehydrogenase